MRQSVTYKLYDVRGESLIESLVSVLIGALSTLLLASIITSAQSMIAAGEATMTEYYRQDAILAKQTGDDGKVSGSPKVTIADGSGTQIGLPVDIVAYENNAIHTTTVVSYKQQ